MATGAEPQPAALPLPGGLEGATVRLRPLLCGTVRSPPAYVHRVDGRGATLKALGLGVPSEEHVTLPIVAFLIEHPGAGLLLVDTGLHPSVAVDPRENLGRLGARIFSDLDMEASQAVSAQLRARGLQTSDIGAVVMTHLHLDHASAMAEFPSSTFLFSGDEWTAATAAGSTFHGYRRAQFDHAFDYRSLDFDAPEAESFASFGRSLDLFGDGSVRLVSTPGHTLGHLSVVLRLSDREVLLVGDAAFTSLTLDFSHLPWRTEDEHRFRRSLREIQLYREQTPGALIVPGHDMHAWQQLAPAYS